MFDHQLQEFVNIKSVQAEFGRYYNTPDGEWYPSVTTIIGAFPEQGLLDWKARVGPEEAARVGKAAAYRGQVMHNLCEQYLLNEPIDTNVNPMFFNLFTKIKTLLDKHVTTVYGIECPLYSTLMKTAGRCDSVAAWDNQPAILDFKSSTQHKRKEWVQGYFEQMSAYSAMFEERTGVKARKLVVILATEGMPGYYYESHVSNHLPGFCKKVIDYRKIEAKRLTDG